MNSVTFRLAGPQDAPQLAQFAADTFCATFAAENQLEHMQAYLDSAFGEAQQLAEILDPDGTTLLAERGGQMLAYAQLQRRAPPLELEVDSLLEVHRFYVDEREHGRGLAQQLMAQVRAVAQQRAATHLWLSVWERNSRAIAFYRRQGFVDVGATFFMLGPDRQNDRVMLGSAHKPPSL